MNTNDRSIVAAILISAAPLVSYAGSLECQGNIISTGVTEAQLLEACGKPTSRNGANWRSEIKLAKFWLRPVQLASSTRFPAHE